MSDRSKKSFEVKWRIENIRPWFETRNDTFCSPQFHAETLTNTCWKLRLSRKLHLTDKYITLALERDVGNDIQVLNYELSFLACDGSALKSRSCTSKFVPKTQELYVKEIEILDEKKEAYLPEGVLTVCCKLWMSFSSILKGGQCSIRSVIGRKRITLDGTIDYFSRLGYDSNVTVNFMSPSEEISFISFNVKHPSYDNMRFERTEVECKCFISYSCKLFTLNATGERKECSGSHCLATLLTSHKSCSFEIFFSYEMLNCSKYLKNDTLALQLEITCYPGVESEYIEYDDNNDKKLTNESSDLGNMNFSNSEKVHTSPIGSLYLSQHVEKPCENEEYKSIDEDEGFDAAGKKNLLSTTLKMDLASLYNDRLFCDTKLGTDTETFPAHRNVLSARSPVFKKMFTTDMKEKAGECIDVPDISSDTVRRMLQFLYTDCTEDLEMQSAKDLYIASDKYDIASLKQRCCSFMKKNLCPANVCEILVLSDLHQDKDLESAAQEYVLTNDEEVFYSDEWKLFMKSYSGLAAQVMYLKFTKK